MTNVVPALKSQSAAVSFNLLTLVNIALVVVCAVAALYYVLWANGIAAREYRLSTLRSQLAQTTAEQSALVTAAAVGVGPYNVEVFVHLVEVRLGHAGVL